ncbi:hypothetical protein HYX10_06285 [Candidatus Woesearchaeota archaeon]|nr:hypothetical protein [Candidatus Woesearchaeota archaeon]
MEGGHDNVVSVLIVLGILIGGLFVLDLAADQSSYVTGYQTAQYKIGWNQLTSVSQVEGKTMEQLSEEFGCPISKVLVGVESGVAGGQEFTKYEDTVPSGVEGSASIWVYADEACGSAAIADSDAQPDLTFSGDGVSFRLYNREGRFTAEEIRLGDKLKSIIANVQNAGGDVDELRDRRAAWYIIARVSNGGDFYCENTHQPMIGPNNRFPTAAASFGGGAYFEEKKPACEFRSGGKYTVTVQLDSLNYISEANEENNFLEKEISILETYTAPSEDSCSDYRKGDIYGDKYCDIDDTWKERVAGGKLCNKHYQCQHYVCLNGVCVDEEGSVRLITGG